MRRYTIDLRHRSSGEIIRSEMFNDNDNEREGHKELAHVTERLRLAMLNDFFARDIRGAKYETGEGRTEYQFVILMYPSPMKFV